MVNNFEANITSGVFQVEGTSISGLFLHLPLLKCKISRFFAGVPQAPFAAIDDLFRKVADDPVLVSRANNAYKKNLVFKDAYGQGQGGADVDEKKVMHTSQLDCLYAITTQYI